MAFTRKYESCSKSSDKEISNEELVATYRLFYTKWQEECIVGEKQKITISALHWE